jgi:hypothetical protein
MRITPQEGGGLKASLFRLSKGWELVSSAVGAFLPGATWKIEANTAASELCPLYNLDSMAATIRRWLGED